MALVAELNRTDRLIIKSSFADRSMRAFLHSFEFILFRRIAIMSIRNEKSGGKSATLKELHEVFGRSAVYLGCGELQSGLKSYLPAFLSSNKKMPLGASARFAWGLNCLLLFQLLQLLLCFFSGGEGGGGVISISFVLFFLLFFRVLAIFTL